VLVSSLIDTAGYFKCGRLSVVLFRRIKILYLQQNMIKNFEEASENCSNFIFCILRSVIIVAPLPVDSSIRCAEPRYGRKF